jgi:hypothetical protein
MTPSNPTRPHYDTRPEQVDRVADYLELHPDSTAKEFDAACDVGSVTKILSDMPRLGYGISRGLRRRDVDCDGVQRSRRVRTYALLYRPSTQDDLFTDS